VPVDLVKAPPVKLRDVGVDERWLQDQIQADTSILGLGDLEIAGKEHRQPSGGRIDFLLRNDEADTYYEVEIMLGAVDESHIIRTIEYWDIERQRRPNFEHRAVIVAEEITARFFNVLRLLNRAVPLIVIKLSCFRSGENGLLLHPIIVLDIMEEVFDDDGDGPSSTRQTWEKKSPSTISVMDHVASTLKAIHVDPRITYNQKHIAVGGAGRNFCWFYARKSQDRCRIKLRIGSDQRDQTLSELQENGLDASPRGTRDISFGATTRLLDDRSNQIMKALEQADAASKL
jgi:hypothetical protein